MSEEGYRYASRNFRLGVTNGFFFMVGSSLLGSAAILPLFLNEIYNSVGVAIRPHKTYRVNCVMDFGQKNRSDLNTVPY